MADLLNFDDDYDFFTEHKQGDLKDSNKELDDLFDVNSGHVSDDSLDDILKPSKSEEKPSIKPVKKRQKSFKKKSRLLEENDFDPFSPPSQKSGTDQLVPPTVGSGTKQTTSSVTSTDSLDFLLDSQPLGTVPSSDDLLSLDPFLTPIVRHKDHSKDKGEELMDPFWSPETDMPVDKGSKKADFGDDLDFLSSPNTQAEVSEKPADDIFGLNYEPIDASVMDKRDDLIGRNNQEMNKPADLFGLDDEEANETQDLIGLNSKELQVTSEQGSFLNDDLFGTSKEQNNLLEEEFGADADDESNVKHGDILADQSNKESTGPSMNEYLFAEEVVGEESKNVRNNVLHSEVHYDDISNKDSPIETSDPTQDIVESPDDIETGPDRAKAADTEVKDTPQKGKPRKAKLKKSMERSFEDLLHGLSDESEPELDEMILSDDNDNTNLESILVSPGQSKSKFPDKDSDEFSTPARHASNTDDIMTSTPGMDTVNEPSPDIKASPIEVKVHKPDDEENDGDVDSWEMIDKEDADIVEPRETETVEDKAMFDDADDDINDIVMGNRNRSAGGAGSADDKEIDLSAIEDANHLDVDISKHKSALGKKGSMALRRKQSRKSRRSVMANGEDAIFVDSTGPKSSEMVNGEGDCHGDLEDDLQDDKDSENFDMSPPAKKPSPSMLVPLPGMSSRPPSQRLSSSTPDDENEDEIPKPAKRISKPPPGAFILPDVKPHLTPKPSPSVETKKETDSSSHTFEKPVLRSSKATPVKESIKDDKNSFDTPALRSVQRRERETPSVGEDRDVTFEKPALRRTSKSREQTPESETPETTHTFDKPKLRSTSKTEIDNKADEQKRQESSTMFEKPVLRSAKAEKQGSVTEDSENVSHTFEKPALKSTGFRNTEARKDTGTVGLFDKPVLRKTPSPEKEVRPSNEVKGTFDKPSLRKTENSPTVSDTSIGKSDYKSSFPEMKLRKTTSPQKEVVAEKPSWLKDAAEKQSKVLDVLHSKENTNNSSKKEVPSWLDKTPVLKGSRGQPLQDTSNNHSELMEERKPTPRSREPSIGSENDPDSRRTSTSESKSAQSNYVPSWMRQGRSPSIGSSGFNSPAKTITDSNEVPQWKKDLAQRRASRKEQSPVVDMPKQDGSSEPEWKKNIQLRKTRPGDTPARDKQSVEPEWKKAAEEKRARLRRLFLGNTRRSYSFRLVKPRKHMDQ